MTQPDITSFSALTVRIDTFTIFRWGKAFKDVPLPRYRQSLDPPFKRLTKMVSICWKHPQIGGGVVQCQPVAVVNDFFRRQVTP